MRGEGGYGLASRDVQAKVVAEAERSAKTCALSANRGLSSLASESLPLIFGSARRRRGRGGAWRDAKCCGAGDNFSSETAALGYPRAAKVGLLVRRALSGKQCCMQLGRVRWANAELLARQSKDAMRGLKLTTLKLRLTRVKGAAHEWLVSFLTDRVQVTVVNGTISWSTCPRLFADVPPGTILSPLLFSVYMNDISFLRTINLFADDISSYISDSVPSSLESKLQERTDLLSECYFKWHLTVIPTKSAVDMVFRSKKMQPVSIQITIDTHRIPEVSDHRHVGVTFSEILCWTRHTDNIVHAASTKVGLLRRLRKRLSTLIIRQLYLTCIRISL